MDDPTTIRFTLTPAGGVAVDVRLRRAGERWLARIGGDQGHAAIGASAHAALAAAVQLLGQPAVSALLADLCLLEPSLRVRQLERALGG